MGGGGEVRFIVRLTPRGGMDRVDGVEGGILRVRVAAPPAAGAANAALIRLVAEAIGVPRSSVTIARGASSRTKTVAVAGRGRDDLVAVWPGLDV